MIARRREYPLPRSHPPIGDRPRPRPASSPVGRAVRRPAGDRRPPRLRSAGARLESRPHPEGRSGGGRHPARSEARSSGRGVRGRLLPLVERQGLGARGFKLFHYQAANRACIHLGCHLAGRSPALHPSLPRQHLRRLPLPRARGDTFDAYLSRELATAADRWLHFVGKSTAPDDNVTVRVDCQDYLRFNRTLTESIRAARDLLPEERTHTLTYEAFTRAFDARLAQVQRFLGVNERPIEQPLLKQATRSRWEYVENAAEVQRFPHDKHDERASPQA